MENNKQLRILIEKAKAPITNRKVACLLITKKDEIFKGYNIERAKNILHAEEMAVNNAIKKDDNFKIKEIHLMANGEALNIKRSIPCENCSSILKNYCEKDSKIIFHFFDNPNKKYLLNLEGLIKEYRSFKKVPLLLEKNSFNEYFKNHLSEVDKEFLTEFMKMIKQKCSELYITGSASKRGGPKQLLAKKITGLPYLDMDLIAIFSETDKNQINEIVKKAILSSLKKIGYVKKELLEKEMPSYVLEENPTSKDSEGFIFRKIYWIKEMESEITPPEYKKNPLLPSIIDLSAGINLKETITKKYLNKNWLVRLF